MSYLAPKMWHKKNITLLFLVFCIYSSNAQLRNDIFKDSFNKSPKKKKKTSFSLRAMHYAQNSEYFGSIAQGQTWLGYSVLPKISYKVYDDFTISGGLFARKDHGRNEFSELEPFFRMTLSKKNWKLNLGNLEAAANHDLLEPILSYESNIHHQTEHGVQFITDLPKLKLDAWIDWNVAAFDNDPFQEELTAGLSSKIKVFQSKNTKTQIDIPLQSLIIHRGGQVNSPTDPLVTRQISSLGINIIRKIQKTNMITLFSNILYSSDHSGSLRRNYKEGYGMLSGMNFKKKNLELAYIFWYGEEFETDNGLALYSSGTSRNLNVREQIRQSSSVRAVYTYPFNKSVNLDFRAGIHFDHLKNRIDHDAGLFLVVNL